MATVKRTRIGDRMFSILCCCADAKRYVTPKELVEYVREDDEAVQLMHTGAARNIVSESCKKLVNRGFLKVRQVNFRTTAAGKAMYEPRWKITDEGREWLESTTEEI